jgi:hypothetical protein
MKLSYSEYRNELSSLSKVYRDAYRADLKSLSEHIRGRKRKLREAFPKYSERYALEIIQCES